jgi:DNA damage-binding protein 1
LLILDFHGKPTIGYIYQDNHGRHLKVTAIDTREKEFHMLWKQDNVESEAALIIPVPYYGGAIVIGQEAISYHRVNIRVCFKYIFLT